MITIPTILDLAGNPHQALPVMVVSGSATPGSAVTPGSPYDASPYGSVIVTVTGLSGGDTLSFTQQTVDSGTFYPVSGIARADYSTVATISQDGIYDFPGGGVLKYTKTGTASTPTVTLRAGA